MLEKANLFLMNKEATEKNISLKTQLLLSTNSQSPKKISGEQLWRKQGFFLTKGLTLISKREISLRMHYATSTRGISPWSREVN